MAPRYRLINRRCCSPNYIVQNTNRRNFNCIHGNPNKMNRNQRIRNYNMMARIPIVKFTAFVQIHGCLDHNSSKQFTSQNRSLLEEAYTPVRLGTSGANSIKLSKIVSRKLPLPIPRYSLACLGNVPNRHLLRDQVRHNLRNIRPGMGNSSGLRLWITVFGFPPIAMNCALRYICNKVHVVDWLPAMRSEDNWIHVMCATDWDVQQALKCNGNVVCGSIMIGVTKTVVVL